MRIVASGSAVGRNREPRARSRVPRLDIELSGGTKTVEERSIGSGMRDSSFGLRLRYEIRREVAPYIGVSWQRAYGTTRELIEQDGGDASDVTAVAGLRFWF
jgi:copper resistance protein B